MNDKAKVDALRAALYQATMDAPSDDMDDWYANARKVLALTADTSESCTLCGGAGALDVLGGFGSICPHCDRSGIEPAPAAPVASQPELCVAEGSEGRRLCMGSCAESGICTWKAAPVADARAVAWAVTAKKGGIHKLSITRESAERKAARWIEEWPNNECRVRPLIFGDAPATPPTADSAADAGRETS